MSDSFEDDLRLIEKGFPCHQIGAETQRERSTGTAPPTHRLHVWWARRPLTPSRAAILASLLPADADINVFLKNLGIEQIQVKVNGTWWTISDTQLKRLEQDSDGQEWYRVDHWTLKWLEKENKQREKQREIIERYKNQSKDPHTLDILDRWEEEIKPIPEPFPEKDRLLSVRRIPGDPAWAKRRISWENDNNIRTNVDKYGYSRGYQNSYNRVRDNNFVVLDPTAGGGSIPFESLRMGYETIANELNPVAAVILRATLDFPNRFGDSLLRKISSWGNRLRDRMVNDLTHLFPISLITDSEKEELEKHLEKTGLNPEDYITEKLDGFLYVRQVTCPHCLGEAPLLNMCWLSKQSSDNWAVKIVPDGKKREGTVRFETYRVKGGKGPNGEDPDFSTVARGVGQCMHCKQAISAEVIKRQARGESKYGTWTDRLYCVVANRYQPKLDKNGRPKRYKSGEKAGEIKTEKITFFRPPNEQDLQALEEAEKYLDEKWPAWERDDLIPTESIPEGHKTAEPLRVGMNRWCDMFTPRQLVGHLTMVEELNRLKPLIMDELGEEKGRAVITYLQFAIDKGIDYNSKQTRWIPQRQIVSGTFGRHDFSVKWTFGEMIFTGPNSGAAWGLNQILDAYQGIAELVKEQPNDNKPSVQILNRTAAHLPEIADGSVDLVVMDPPYYNNVQYAELSDYYYVWQKRTLHDLYPGIYGRRLTNKNDEAVANPHRDGSNNKAESTYESMMGDIFGECQRVLKDNGLMTLMFTHKSQEAWEALTRALIEFGWIISSCFPVESEFGHSQHIMDQASATSSVFLSCRKRDINDREPTSWTGFGGTGVQHKVRESVREGLKEFESLNLGPVDELVASYGRALRVLSKEWPVVDGEKEVSPIRAMNEASRVVAENQIAKITNERMRVEDLNPEASMALTLYGIYGLGDIPYDDALNLSRSLGIQLKSHSGGYSLDGRMIGVNSESRGSSKSGSATEDGYFAPLVRSGSKLRLALPNERNQKRIDNPQSEWDVLHGIILSYREGDIPVARAYLQQHSDGKEQLFLDLLQVWTTENPEPDLRKEGQHILFGLQD